MKNAIVLKLILLICSQFAFSQDYTLAKEKARFLIENHKEQTQIPGVQVAVLIKDSLVWSEGFGVSDIEKDLPVDPHIKFRIASVSKSLTSLALGKMMQDNRIDIDKPIRAYLP